MLTWEEMGQGVNDYGNGGFSSVFYGTKIKILSE